jgi:exonuclease SbcD
MKILHTSDWHIGRTLYGRKRYDEFEVFLSWLADLLETQCVEVLLVAGDVFDNSTPSNRAQQLYYQFLGRIAHSSTCRHVVVIAGNHDSPSFLNAPRDLLRFLHVHVVGMATEPLADEVLLLKDDAGVEKLIVCAVPYLRDRDIRTAEAGESLKDKERKLLEGICSHYNHVCQLAEEKRAVLGRSIPMVAMGHLFTAGGHTVEGDGVRELYVGSLAHVASNLFPGSIDYLALGHLHVPQMVGNIKTRRYAGSPLAMGFGEAQQLKSVCLVDFGEAVPQVNLIEVPTFQKLERISGSWSVISTRLSELKSSGTKVWLEIDYQGDQMQGNLRERLDDAIAGSAIEILRIKNNRVLEKVLSGNHPKETLDDLDLDGVFTRCLDLHEIPYEQRSVLLSAYRETVNSLYEEDKAAE